MAPSYVTKTKVCHLTHEGTLDGGGATFSLSYFPAYLSDFDVFAIVGNNGDLGASLIQKGVRTFPIPMTSPLITFFSIPKLLLILFREKPDALIVHGQWGGFFGAIVGRIARVQTILYFTQFPSFYTDWTLFRIFRNWFAEKVTCKLSSKIVCPSLASYCQYLIRHIDAEEKFVHIPNAIAPLVDTHFERHEFRKTLGLPSSSLGPLVVSVSRLVDQKRIDWLLEAWKVVGAKIPNAHLAIIGSGLLNNDLQNLATHLDLKNCHFLGPQMQGYRYFQAADVGVICSLFEAHPLALVEAMFAKCPMVGTCVDGIEETIINGDTGILVAPGDTASLAEAIIDLILDRERANRMAEAAYLRAMTLYRLDDVICRQITLLKVTLAEADQPTHVG